MSDSDASPASPDRCTSSYYKLLFLGPNRDHTYVKASYTLGKDMHVKGQRHFRRNESEKPEGGASAGDNQAALDSSILGMSKIEEQVCRHALCVQKSYIRN